MSWRKRASLVLATLLVTVVFAKGAAAVLDPVAQMSFTNVFQGGSGGRVETTGIATVYEDSVSDELFIELRKNTARSPAFTVKGNGVDPGGSYGTGDHKVIIKAFVHKGPGDFDYILIDGDAVVNLVTGSTDYGVQQDDYSVDIFFHAAASSTLDVQIDWLPVSVADQGYPLLIHVHSFQEGCCSNTSFNYVPFVALKGKVTNGGSPVAGVVVKLFNAERSYEDTTDSGGNYEIKDVFVGNYTLEAGTCDKEKSISLTVEGGWTTQDLNLVARSLGTVSGTVTGGIPPVPLLNAIVSNYCTTASDLTDSNGDYSLQMPIDVEIVVEAEKSGYVAQFQPATAPESDVDFLLPQDCPHCPNNPSQG